MWSADAVHERIVSRELFQAAQDIFRSRRHRPRRPRRTAKPYMFAGILRCGLCGRRMSGQRNHDRPYYRCRYPDDYGIGEAQHPRNVYVRESAVEPGLDEWLASLFNEEHLDETARILAGASQPDPKAEARRLALLEEIADCDHRYEQYKAVLDAGGDAKVVARWMAEVRQERATLEAQLGHTLPGGKLEPSHIRALVEALHDIVMVLAEADPEDKARLYHELGVEMTYHPEGTVSVRMAPRGQKVRVGGRIRTLHPRGVPEGRFGVAA